MSAEFRRNVWLELTPHRLVSMPAILGALFWLAWLIDDGASLLGRFAYWGLVLLGLVWGTRLAAESVIQEVNARTWDGQRMTSTGPWAMTWGKLLGSTVHVWYGCALCAAAFGWASVAGADADAAHAARRLALVAAAMVLAHAVAFGLGLLAVRKAGDATLGRGVAPFAIALLAVLPVLLPAQRGVLGDVHWWGEPIAGADFVLASMLAFAAWSVIGAWRLMRAELQVPNAPWLWCAFVAYAMAWTAGLAGSRLDLGDLEVSGIVEPALPRLAVAFLVGLAVFYAMLLVEPKDPVALRRMLAAVRGAAARRALEMCPRWALALLLAALPGAAIVLVGKGLFGAPSAVPATLAIAAWLFALRDAGLVMWLNAGRNQRRADTAALVYLLVLYVVVPPLARFAGLGAFTALFIPDPAAGFAGATLPVLAEVVVVWGLARARWRRSYGRPA